MAQPLRFEYRARIKLRTHGANFRRPDRMAGRHIKLCEGGRDDCQRPGEVLCLAAEGLKDRNFARLGFVLGTADAPSQIGQLMRGKTHGACHGLAMDEV